MGHRLLLNPVLPVLQEWCKLQFFWLLRFFFFFSITPKYVPKMFFNSLFHNKAGTCLCSQSVAGRRKGNFLMFSLQTCLKLQPLKKNSPVNSTSAMQKPAGTAAAHPQNSEHIIQHPYGTEEHNTPSQGISVLPKAQRSC